MKAIILAAGYATRLYPLTLNMPKALLKVNDKSVIDYIVDEIETIDDINEIIVISNHKFIDHFLDWKAGRSFSKEVTVVDDGTSSDETKLGAIGDIEFLIEKKNINEEIFVIAGDNLFTYKLADYYKFFKDIKKDCILIQQMQDENELKRMGIVVLDSSNKVLDFEEKPEKPKSNCAVFAAYFYLKETLPLFKKYLDEGNKCDAPGYFPAWLYKYKDIHAYKFSGECYDIGTPSSYKEVQDKF